MVVVVDDGSRDDTADIARKAGAVVVRHEVNQGKATAVNTGFNHVRRLGPTAVVLLDGDGQHSADDIPVVLAPVLEGTADIVIGSRFMAVKSEIPAYRQVGQHGLTITTNLASGVWVSDSQSGFRAFTAEALNLLAFRQGGFSLESEMQFLARDHKFRVVEVPIRAIYAERAKRNPFGHGMQVINGIMRLVGQTRPLLFFGAGGMLPFLGGTMLGLYVVDIYARTSELAIGYGLLTVMLCVIGIVLLFAGIMLHSMRGLILDLQRGVMDRLNVVTSPVELGEPPDSQDLQEEQSREVSA
jgi:glycosyltransferase involved in cell wall biosynthesis